ncbi:MAG TPA: ribosomal protein S18-alanine N-acetyltransferase [Thermoanaerobaculia bacterium]|nr:ribosomal protein S18-alanine N-acetyltransferase [Thermoanaerobaculia bacterium]
MASLREPRPGPYRLRPAGPFDLDEVARIERESFPIPWKREFFASELVEPHRYIRILGRDDRGEPRVGGYLFAVSLYEEFHINKIATDQRLRNLGHGRSLLEDAIARARAMGSASMTLEVRVTNAPARQFYRSYGFTEAYRRRAYYQDGEDALVLVLPIEKA